MGLPTDLYIWLCLSQHSLTSCLTSNCSAELKLFWVRSINTNNKWIIFQSKLSRTRSYTCMYTWYIEREMCYYAIICIFSIWKWHSDLANIHLCENISELYLNKVSLHNTSCMTKTWIPKSTDLRIDGKICSSNYSIQN